MHTGNRIASVTISRLAISELCNTALKVGPPYFEVAGIWLLILSYLNFGIGTIKDKVRFCKHTPGAASLTVLCILIKRRKILGIFACPLVVAGGHVLGHFLREANPVSSDRKQGDLGVLRGA